MTTVEFTARNPVAFLLLMSRKSHHADGRGNKKLNPEGRLLLLLTHAPSLPYLLSQDRERPLVRSQAQHNQIRIQSMQDMMLVRVVAWLASLSSHEVHDLVFPFPGLIGV